VPSSSSSTPTTGTQGHRETEIVLINNYTREAESSSESLHTIFTQFMMIQTHKAKQSILLVCPLHSPAIIGTLASRPHCLHVSPL
jgi:hypothetical protein